MENNQNLEKNEQTVNNSTNVSISLPDSDKDIKEGNNINSEAESNNNTPKSQEEIDTLTTTISTIDSNANDATQDGISGVSNEDNKLPQSDSSLNVQPIAPALEEIAAANAPKKKSKKGILFILLLIVIIIAAILFYKFIILKSENTYNKVLNLYAKKVKDSLSVIEPIEDSIMQSGNITIETNIEDIKDLNNTTLEYKYGLDFVNKKIELSANIKENDKYILNALIYLINNKLYLSSEQVYNKMLLMGDYSQLFNISDVLGNMQSSDIIYSVNSVNNSFIKALEKAHYESKDTKINIDSKKVLVTDNIMVINQSNIDSIIKDFYNSIKEDTRLVGIIANFTGYSTDSINSDIDDYLNKEHEYDFDEVTIHIYTKPFTTKLVGINILMDNQETFSMVFNKKNIIITIVDDIKIEAKSANGKEYDVSFYYKGEKKYTFKVTKNNANSYVIEFTIQDYNYKINIDCKKDSNEYTAKVVTEISKDSQYLKVLVNNRIQYNFEVANVNVYSAVDFNTLSSAEQNTIYSNMEKLMDNSKIVESLFGYLGYVSIANSMNKVEIENDNSSELCKKSSIICDKCTGSTCKCEYYDSSAGVWFEVDCPRNY